MMQSIRAPSSSSKVDQHQFIHGALDSFTDEIRLLELVPGFTQHEDNNRNHRIAGKLQHVSLSNAPPYTALSYMWGSRDTNKHFIFFDNCRLSIHKNLYQFLQYQAFQTSQASKSKSTLL